MKKSITLTVLLAALFFSFAAKAQEDKSKRPSPPAFVKQLVSSGATISIDYSQPSVKGRTIGVDLEPKNGEVWRTGANEATVFETDKAVKLNGSDLPAGKYGLFTIAGSDSWTIIFNKTWKQWGAFKYNAADDVLRVKAVPQVSTVFTEKMTFTVDKNGVVTLLWGNIKVGFTVE